MHLLPTLFDPTELEGGIAVMIDVLRASTTIIHALAAGAKVLVPCETVDQARDLRADRSGDETVLGGERSGTRIEGFDLGNSPFDYTEETVWGKTVIFTTTNGTQALLRCREADRILIGAFVNQSALCESLRADKRPVHLVCAGTNGEITAEDVLCAGAIASALLPFGKPSMASAALQATDLKLMNDSARLAVDFYTGNSQNDTSLGQAVLNSLGGRNLQRLGFEADIRRAASVDLFDLVPEFSPQTGRVHLPAAAAKVRKQWSHLSEGTGGARPRR